MRELLSPDPRFLPLYAAAVAVFAMMAIVSALGAATPDNGKITPSGTGNAHKLAADECRLDQHARTPYCKVQGRTVRVIGF